MHLFLYEFQALSSSYEYEMHWTKRRICVKYKMYPLADILICMLPTDTELSSMQVLAIANRLLLLETQQIPTNRLHEFYFLLNHYYLCVLNLSNDVN